jgi:hypothetical protein
MLGLETLKIYYDFSKHLTTLDTAAAVILVAITKPDYPYWTLALLGLSVVLALLAMTRLSIVIREVEVTV